MMALRLRMDLLLACGVIAVLAGAAARADPLPVELRRFQVQPRWLFGDALDDTQLNAMVAEVSTAEFRFNAAGYAGARVRIRMTVPVAIACLRTTGSLWAQWRARPSFREGRARAGQRVVLFEGTLPADKFSEFFDWQIYFDARAMLCPFDVTPEFEIERLP